MSRKQRSLARKMHNKLYLKEALLDGTSVLKVFRTHYKEDKSNINNLESSNSFSFVSSITKFCVLR